MSNIEQLKQEHEGEWLAIVVTKKEIEGPTEGDLVHHSTDWKAVRKAIKGDTREIYVTYAGPLVEEGHAVAF
ncbi:MAG: hypothetical protein FI707_14620 [SAR202 cluster bacterium]|jgi:hypothetical protein|nr:hypothetical protein [Chloroflexota bacterium]MDP6420744.1 hypothetical protein [SAR202 cluster bacterium]MQG59543.1 hypothetical protein [SAR202 cluster bacterium]MQG70008.1 hypothetical protein [SAR202 cluster bacterium]|tara:strand:- start:4609 stop:4824 length:216 start_codon:yes stop_codon:yes gene_type:complete